MVTLEPAISRAAEEAIRLADHFNFYVFPILPNSKDPLPGKSWKEISTNDPEQIRRIATYEGVDESGNAVSYRHCNWALDCEKSGASVLDIDLKTKETGELVNGLDTLESLYPELEPGGLISQTPRGGQHHFFLGKMKNSADKLGPGLDTRGPGGYVVLPGSISKHNKPYTWVSFGTPKSIPGWLSQAVGRPSERKPEAQTPITEEKDHHVETAIRYLKAEAPEAIEGSGGDRTTYEVCCRLRDLGVGEGTAASLLLEHWNPSKAHPPWDGHDLQVKVRNAYRYAKDRQGNATPEAVFGAAIPDFGEWESAASITSASIKPRDWVLGQRYMAGSVTVTAADGGVGKSLLSYLEGFSVASGKQLTHDKVYKKGRVLLFNAEEPLDEIHRRVYAARLFHCLTDEDSADLAIKSGAGQNWRLLLPHSGEPVVRQELIDFFVKEVERHEAVLLMLDPLIRFHGVDENSSVMMDRLCDLFLHIAWKTNAAVSLVHHTNKDPHTTASMKAVRGSSSIIAAARTGRVACKMTPADAKQFGLPPSVAPNYFQIAAPKGNYAPPGAAAADWYKLETVKVGHFMRPWGMEDEHAPTVRPVTFDRVVCEGDGEEDKALELRAEICQLVTVGKPASLYKLCLMAQDKLGLKETSARRKIASLFSGEEGYRVNGLTWAFQYGRRGDRDVAELHCTLDSSGDSK
jgi:hypothetical protein